MRKREIMKTASKRRLAMLKMRRRGKTFEEIGEAFPTDGKPISRQRVAELVRQAEDEKNK